MANEFNTGDMLDVYLFENQQLLENLQDMVLAQKDADAFDEDSINEIFRTMHTIKGSSGIMMFDEITKASHKLEDIFFYLRESHPDNVPHQELITCVLDTAGWRCNRSFEGFGCILKQDIRWGKGSKGRYQKGAGAIGGVAVLYCAGQQ